jgi:hypothetical protein
VALTHVPPPHDRAAKRRLVQISSSGHNTNSDSTVFSGDNAWRDHACLFSFV